MHGYAIRHWTHYTHDEFLDAATEGGGDGTDVAHSNQQKALTLSVKRQLPLRCKYLQKCARCAFKCKQPENVNADFNFPVNPTQWPLCRNAAGSLSAARQPPPLRCSILRLRAFEYAIRARKKRSGNLIWVPFGVRQPTLRSINQFGMRPMRCVFGGWGKGEEREGV